ncbi:MAG: DNA repair protein RecO [Alphaproteobacteria bacterium]|nr:DNA repair protein RecO [Alphaproteobacteria bacterium]
MEKWTDQGIVLSARPHGEGGAVVSLITENHGRHAGYVHGGMSSAKRNLLQAGTFVQCDWHSRVSENLGSYALEAEHGLSPDIMQDSLKLAALLSACSLCDAALPEREGHAGLYHGLQALIEALEGEHWGAVYVMWEISLLRELGFRLELDKCAGGGDVATLCYVSPKSGRAVSKAQAAPYKEKLFTLPNFLRPESARDGEAGNMEDILAGLKMTAHFLEHWVFTHHSKGVPEPRVMFEERYTRGLSSTISRRDQFL